MDVRAIVGRKYMPFKLSDRKRPTEELKLEMLTTAFSTNNSVIPRYKKYISKPRVPSLDYTALLFPEFRKTSSAGASPRSMMQQMTSSKTSKAGEPRLRLKTHAMQRHMYDAEPPQTQTLRLRNSLEVTTNSNVPNAQASPPKQPMRFSFRKKIRNRRKQIKSFSISLKSPGQSQNLPAILHTETDQQNDDNPFDLAQETERSRAAFDLEAEIKRSNMEQTPFDSPMISPLKTPSIGSGISNIQQVSYKPKPSKKFLKPHFSGFNVKGAAIYNPVTNRQMGLPGDENYEHPERLTGPVYSDEVMMEPMMAVEECVQSDLTPIEMPRNLYSHDSARIRIPSFPSN